MIFLHVAENQACKKCKFIENKFTYRTPKYSISDVKRNLMEVILNYLSIYDIFSLVSTNKAVGDEILPVKIPKLFIAPKIYIQLQLITPYFSLSQIEELSHFSKHIEPLLNYQLTICSPKQY
jgi:hypothetical protein